MSPDSANHENELACTTDPGINRAGLAEAKQISSYIESIDRRAGTNRRA